LLDRKAEIEPVDLNKGLSAAELDNLIGKRDYKEFLNTRNELYRRLGMKQDPPQREQALRLMAENPNLIKRPIMKIGNKLLVGFKPEEAAPLLGDV